MGLQTSEVCAQSMNYRRTRPDAPKFSAVVARRMTYNPQDSRLSLLTIPGMRHEAAKFEPGYFYDDLVIASRLLPKGW
jgi:hypothetical protein